MATFNKKNMAHICNHKKCGVKKIKIRNCFFKYAIEDNEVV